MKIAYNGFPFHGWQIQPGQRTVQGEIEENLAIILQQVIRLQGTSRTDAGVHALCQTAHFDAVTDKEVTLIQRALNRRLDPLIDILDLQIAPDNFHARFDASGKFYRYRIWNCDRKPLFCSHEVYWFPRPRINVKLMQDAAQQLIGTHDFKSFGSNADREGESTERTLWSINVSNRGEEVWIDIRGQSFLYKMVRGISGTLLDVGTGKSLDLSKILRARDRMQAGRNLPASGLTLMEVIFPDHVFPFTKSPTMC